MICFFDRYEYTICIFILSIYLVFRRNGRRERVLILVILFNDYRLEYAREFFIDPAEEEAEAAELAKRMEMEKAARLLAGDEEKSDGSEEAGSEAGGGDEQRQAVALLPDAATGQDAEMMRELQKRAMDEGETSPQKAQSPSLSSRRLSELDEDDEAGRQNRMGRRRSTLAVDEERSMVRISKGIFVN